MPCCGEWRIRCVLFDGFSGNERATSCGFGFFDGGQLVFGRGPGASTDRTAPAQKIIPKSALVEIVSQLEFFLFNYVKLKLMSNHTVAR